MPHYTQEDKRKPYCEKRIDRQDNIIAQVVPGKDGTDLITEVLEKALRQLLPLDGGQAHTQDLYATLYGPPEPFPSKRR
jgi:hypothetical protein